MLEQSRKGQCRRVGRASAEEGTQTYAAPNTCHPESKWGPPRAFKPRNDALTGVFSGRRDGLVDLQLLRIFDIL